jgi:hypothetical protein
MATQECRGQGLATASNKSVPAFLAAVIQRTAFAVSSEESRYTLNGALLLLKPETLTMVAYPSCFDVSLGQRGRWPSVALLSRTPLLIPHFTPCRCYRFSPGAASTSAVRLERCGLSSKDF